MPKSPKEFLLKYGIPVIAIVLIGIQLFYVNTQNLTKWKGGGFGMYTGIHFYYDQIYIPGMSVDSLLKENRAIADAFGILKIMPNDKNLRTAAELVLKRSGKDSIHLQLWKPSVNSKNGVYSRVLFNEIHLKSSDL